MSEIKRTDPVAGPFAALKTLLQKLLDCVEIVGNKVPDPTVIFLILAGLVIFLSHVLHLLGVSVTYETVNLQTHGGDGVRFMPTSMVRKFVSFGPAGIGYGVGAETITTVSGAESATSTSALSAPPLRFTSSRRYSAFPAAERSGSFIGTESEPHPPSSNAATSQSTCHFAHARHLSPPAADLLIGAPTGRLDRQRVGPRMRLQFRALPDFWRKGSQARSGSGRR